MVIKTVQKDEGNESVGTSWVAAVPKTSRE